MPSKFFHEIGLSQKEAFAGHMLLYFTPMLYLFEKYIFNDWDYLVSLMLLFFLDTFVGALAAVVEGKFKPTIGLKGFGLKLIGYTLTIACIGIIDKTLIAGKANILEGVVDAGAFAIMISFEGASVLKNIYRIYPFKPIKIILSRLEIYYNKQKDRIETD